MPKFIVSIELLALFDLKCKTELLKSIFSPNAKYTNTNLFFSLIGPNYKAKDFLLVMCFY